MPPVLTPGSISDLGGGGVVDHGLLTGLADDDHGLYATDSDLTAALALKAPLPAWTSYTPAWTAATTNPVLGNGVIEGAYSELGKLLFVQIALDPGTTTTYGTGAWQFSIPGGFTRRTEPSPASFDRMPVGSAWGIDAGTAYYAGTVICGATGLLMVAGNAGIDNWRNSIPITWTNDDSIGLEAVIPLA